MGAALAKIGKKLLIALLGDKKGRKTLGYIVGIVIFFVMLPMIATMGLFGWMSNIASENLFDSQMIYEAFPDEYKSDLENIERVFKDRQLSNDDISKAKTIYVSCLAEHKNEDEFLNTYADCFINNQNDSELLSKISAAFNVKFSDADIEQFQSIYGK